jgi:hypothetical protein
MARPLYDDDTLRRYLLGTASADEAARLDELSLTDDDCALALASVENDLVDAYARTSLTASERAQFERHYLASPLRREKAFFAEELLRIGNRAAAALPTAKRETPRRPARFVWLNLSPLQGALAMAALLLLAAGVWLIGENRRLRREAGAERAALLQRVSELQAGQTVADNNQAELARLRERLTQLEARPVAPTTLPAAPGVQLFTFALAAPIRGAFDLQRIEIPHQVSMVAVKLELETSAYPRYRVVLRDPLTNRVGWQSDKLAAVKGRNGAALNIRLPANLFATQRYAFELSGIKTNNIEERLSNYSFEVSRP